MADNNNNNANVLPYSEMQSMRKVLLELFMRFPNFPTGFTAKNTTVLWNSLPENVGFGIFQMSGAFYLQKYLSGSYKAQLPFQIVYKSNPTTNKANINASDMLDELAEYFSNIKNETMGDGITIDLIEQTSPVFVADKDEKTTSLAVNMQVKFIRKK